MKKENQNRHCLRDFSMLSAKFYFLYTIFMSISIAWILICLGIWKIIDFIIIFIDDCKKIEKQEQEKQKILFPFTK